MIDKIKALDEFQFETFLKRNDFLKYNKEIRDNIILRLTNMDYKEEVKLFKLINKYDIFGFYPESYISYNLVSIYLNKMEYKRKYPNGNMIYVDFKKKVKVS